MDSIPTSIEKTKDSIWVTKNHGPTLKNILIQVWTTTKTPGWT